MSEEEHVNRAFWMSVVIVGVLLVAFSIYREGMIWGWWGG